MLAKFINSFLPPNAAPTPEELRSSRILVKFLLITGLLSLVYIAHAISIRFYPMQYVLLGNAVVAFLLACLFRRGMHKTLCANLFLVSQAAGVFIAIWYGGGMESPSTIGVLLLPVTSLLLAGRKSSIIWLVLSLAGLFFVYWYESSVQELPVTYDARNALLNLYNSLAGIMIFLFLTTLVFDVEKTNALNSLIRANQELTVKQVEILAQRDELTKTLSELKTAQAQLMQSEKMAWLGELMAGIAHEIQNPLNFINNFSELNVELTDELRTMIGDIDNNEATSLAENIRENEQKINQHGRRADSIVKNMLLHSRAVSNDKEPADINALTGEYLRLSYHGLRAKDSTFNANFHTAFDDSIGKIAVVPQDIGRVLLNLFNNAFYAVNEKKKRLNGSFEPVVSVSTRKANGNVEIIIHDNGTGIPEKAVDKIYQPFFTTKPAGEGTGLGLSLSYDIITKSHGGHLKVETKEGEGATFVIQLPVS